ncbi:MAG: tRNA (N6-threonylcarbamoyladenosine(37)-N6)-methyltransferase TrmO [Clostridia bacterium]|nr:tRNA (N6-threonylcarbamoyladenosine(37)-N6)-methyltransferase TrmO [Clostridia bacterium]NCC42719.1 tRNA (N6-threonylcarbamoyladenosine(37)-N6)-methyltransferase TrmO [Clostridia bacterium]
MRPIAHIHSDFPTKFGIPRQSGLVSALRSSIVFVPQYRTPEALRGLEEFSHIWLIWEFSESIRTGWTPTVRPPRLGGNTRMGVFATRSPFRPNPLGLSSVKLDSIEWDTPQGAILHISGADLMDGTPIYDIKPYIPFADSHPDATGGFADLHKENKLQVHLPDHLKSQIPPELLEALIGVLENDPRPAYQNDPERIYGFPFAHLEIRFQVDGSILTITEILLENT